MNGEAAVYSVDEDKLERQIAVNEPVTDTLWSGDRLIFATAKGSVKVYQAGNEVASSSEHAGPATALDSHPGGDIVGSVGSDKSVVFYDLASLKRVSRAYTDSGMFHDGPFSIFWF